MISTLCLVLLGNTGTLAIAPPGQTTDPSKPEEAPEEELSHSWPLGNALSPQKGSHRTRLELRFFELPGGSFVEVAECEVPRMGRQTMYVCAVFNLGKQDGGWIGGDALEVGTRFRPWQGETSFTLGAAYSVFGTIAGIIACEPHEDPDRRDTCPETRLPMEGYVAAGVQTVLPLGAVDASVSAQFRYMGSFSGTVGYEAPQGPAISLGFGLALR